MRTQGCRDQIDWVEMHCHGLSKDAISEVKAASKFVKERAPYLELQTTASITAVRTIKDPIILGKVLQMVKDALAEKCDPRTGDKFTRNLVGVITTPMIKWMIQYAETGEKPPYIRRGSRPKRDGYNEIEVLAIMDELLATKIDRRAGVYPVTEELYSKIRTIREKISCSPVLQ